ncbi:hypothetical protein HMSSN036_10210 [Paenibacillus macerans]|nr:hypothetical protein HMSSN036_10210 [Paenibacillus macerans]
MASAPPGALFMGVSYSGNTKEVLQLFRVAQKYGVRTIGLSRFGNHKVSELADLMLYTPQAPEATLRSGAYGSRLAQLVVIDILFLRTRQRNMRRRSSDWDKPTRRRRFLNKAEQPAGPRLLFLNYVQPIRHILGLKSGIDGTGGASQTVPSYHQYGISPQLVERVKLKMKNPAIKDRIKQMVDGLTRADLQDRPKVRRLVRTAASVLGERLSGTQEEQIVQFVIDQKIDPRNTLHLLRLWGMFR